MGSVLCYFNILTGNMFRLQQSLDFHIKQVHLNGDIKPWSCFYCEFSCKRKNNLRQHFRVKHKMTRPEANAETGKIDIIALQAQYPGVYLG